MSKKDQYNGSGYLDMTAYLAIRNIQRKEAANRRSRKRRTAGKSTKGASDHGKA